MEILLLIFLPLVGAVIASLSGKSQGVKTLAFIWSLLSLGLSAYLLSVFNPNSPEPQFTYDYPWFLYSGIRFQAGIDGISMLMVLLTNGLIPLIILSSFKHHYRNPGAFYALILFMQSGLLLVFTALDGFLFYIGWEAALIPIYFICGIWGGENRIRVNLKFFIYTIFGSLIMLLGIIYMASHTPDGTFSIQSFYKVTLDPATQGWVFWAFFLAFAVKMPVFPFHTWQPDTYTEAPTAGSMLLAGVMLKMGIYGAIRWLIPVAPLGFAEWGPVALLLSITGIVYASIIAFKQKDIKRLIAYSSIAHVGLIAAGVFVWNVKGLQGAMIQMLNHGVNVFGLFFVADILIRRMETRDTDKMGGIAAVAPTFAVAFLVILLGTIALPLTNGFIGEFLLLMGLYNYNLWASVIAGLTIIFGAVYMLRMYQRTMLGNTNEGTLNFKEIDGTEKLVLGIVCLLIIVIGVYPNPILHISEATVKSLVEMVDGRIQGISTTF
ncbi:NADH dehydrogenase subunit M [Arcticibacter tournemirensis]|uniref:NADH-quinone oxidoreductase subunit M n=1 Tax=Arcticibacter tournemirensis TaxID=699437 RepID=A0A5M9H4Y1_9SPHI|nr:NADH-quinone oxidoreductase subunit M [Arcticibacter tournemirensis]KAA8481660.1 NADH-quinone oxidoreductase subunit M [Arcticibacter tournemirensis]TQM48942.1 NADH dehydrogenase subunit M [Arcticibacter tournemirensis]